MLIPPSSASSTSSERPATQHTELNSNVRKNGNGSARSTTGAKSSTMKKVSLRLIPRRPSNRAACAAGNGTNGGGGGGEEGEACLKADMV